VVEAYVDRGLAMIVFAHNPNGELKPRTWKLVTISGRERQVATFTCPNGHTYLLNKYEILPNGCVHPLVLCPADDCNFHELIKLEGWEAQS
jgi:hypothetical protein